jgi:hypothetical protein
LTKKKRKRKLKLNLPCLLFTSQTLALTQQVLVPFEAYVQQRADDQVNNVFAKEVIRSLKEKLASLAAQEGWDRLVSFDQNEVGILSASFELRIIELMVDASPNVREIEQCTKLRQYFQALMT